MVSEVAERLAAVQQRIDRACTDAGRARDEVQLIAVSKTHPAAAIRAAYAAGQRHFGESYAQELAAKAVELADLADLRWHFIGRVQTNKAKLIAPLAYRVHAVHSARHARALAGRSQGPLPVLLAVNLGQEDSKTGVSAAQALSVAQEVHQTAGVQLRGLMTLPPAGEPAGPFFAALRDLAAEGRAAGLPLDELSMGMSSDYPEAIAAGATWVRVGTDIFGAREYP